jgi:hypothetical protein
MSIYSLPACAAGLISLLSTTNLCTVILHFLQGYCLTVLMVQISYALAVETSAFKESWHVHQIST